MYHILASASFFFSSVFQVEKADPFLKDVPTQLPLPYHILPCTHSNSIKEARLVRSAASAQISS